MYHFYNAVALSFHQLTTRWFNPPQHPYIPPADGSSPFSIIPNECVQKIFSFLSTQDDINRCRNVCRQWKQLATDPVFMHNLKCSKEYIRCNVAFGSNKWTKHFGKNAISEEDRKIEIETLPDNIFEILSSNCPAFSGKTVKETHMLVFIPKTINGKPLTLKSLGELARKFFQNNDIKEVSRRPLFFEEIPGLYCEKVDAIVDNGIEPGWRLMTIKNLEESLNKRFDDPTNAPGDQTQQQCVAELAKKTGCDYVVPPALDAAACILAQYFNDSQTRLFSHATYTRCQENIDGCQVMVGAFGPLGLRVHCHFSSAYGSVGVAALRKF